MLNVIMQKDMLYIGDSPVLVVDLKTQKNYIHCEKEDIPFKKRNSSEPGSFARKASQRLEYGAKLLLPDRL